MSLSSLDNEMASVLPTVPAPRIIIFKSFPSRKSNFFDYKPIYDPNYYFSRELENFFT